MSDDPRQGLVILLHGYFRTRRNILPLCNLLTGYGWRARAVGIPSILGTLAECVQTLERTILAEGAEENRIHFVGHSFGGLVIRAFLARNKMTNPGRCVLIGTPSHGARLADLGVRLFPPVTRIIKPLRALVTSAPPISPPLNSPPPEIGIIASNNPRLLTGILIREPSDGRVELSSTPLDGMADFAIVPYVHTKMHNRPETAELVDRFLRTGKFL